MFFFFKKFENIELPSIKIRKGKIAMKYQILKKNANISLVSKCLFDTSYF